ncbi:MAG TPA: hypothetical protein VGB45_10835 [Abditibacterium sp.]|jgi:hypothetical protein
MTPRSFVFWILLSCSVAIALLRALTFAEPLERDQTIYAVAAHEILQGRPLYSDIWDIKPPAIYATFAAAELLVGYGRGAIYLLGIGAAIATLFAIFQVVKTVTGDQFAALWAAFFWVLVSSDMKLQANQPNTESFINALLVWGIYFFVRAYRGAKSTSQTHFLLASAGFCWGAATLYKQVAFLVPIVFALGILCSPPLQASRRSRLSTAGVILAPTFALWALTLAYFEATGRGEIFRFTLLGYGKLYAGEGARVVMAHTSLWRRLLPPELFFLFPLIGLLMFGLRAQKPIPRFWGILGAYALAIQGAVMLPGQFLAHYYQLWLPVAVLGAGFGAAIWRKNSSSRAPTVAFATVSLALLATQFPNWRLPLDEFSTHKYELDYFVQLPQTARAIDELLLPDETFYQMGFDPGLYFATRRRVPVGVLSLGSPYLPPLPDWFQMRIIADLEREKPEMAVVDAAFPVTPVLRYLQKNYRVLPYRGGPEQLVLLARRDGKLSQRLNQKR